MVDNKRKTFKSEEITTIKLRKDTKSRIDNLRTYHRETYDELLLKILDILNQCKLSPERARARLRSIDRQIVSKSNQKTKY